ncbi:MAG: PDZ domain-containing protein [Vicinamibacterales bacterium]
MSRETRLLLTAAALALAVLWLLARIRFQGLPDTPNPIPAVLSQLASTPPYDALAGQIAQIQSRLQPSLLLVDGPVAEARAVAVKLRDDLIVTRLPPGTAAAARRDATVLAHDAASGLAVASSMTANAMPLPLPWTPRRLQQPRYFLATRVSPTGVSLYPVFIAALTPIDTPLWPAQVWAVPAGTELAPGALLFSTDAELAGVVVADGSGVVVAPIALVLAEAERMLSVPPGSGGTPAVEVQALTPAVASVTGAQRGVVVTAAGEQGADGIHVGDVIEAIDGVPITTLHQWRVRVARLSPGDSLALRVRRAGDLRDVTLVAAAPVNPAATPQLGLGLRAVPRVGVEVARVDAGSAAHRSGLMAGDVITLVGNTTAPSPPQVQRAFDAMEDGQRLLIAVTRGNAHMVMVLER